MRSYVKQKKKRRSPAATKNLTELFQMWVLTVIILIIMMCGVWRFFLSRDLHSEIPIPGRDACSETVFHVSVAKRGKGETPQMGKGGGKVTCSAP